MWKIYKHTNKINNKAYIGLTKCNVNIRWKRGFGYSKYQLFRAAIDKYGWDAFDHEIIEADIKTLDEANKREQYWINYYHTYINDKECHGYNMTPGGNATDLCRIKIEKDNNYKIIYNCELQSYIDLGWRKLSQAEVKKLYYLEHRESLLQKSRLRNKEYRQSHKKVLAEKNKQYAEKNKERVKAKQKEWTEKNKIQLQDYKTRWYSEHLDSQKERAKQYYLEHKEEILAKRKLYSKDNKEKIAIYKKEYAIKNKEKLALYKKNYKKVKKAFTKST